MWCVLFFEMPVFTRSLLPTGIRRYLNRLAPKLFPAMFAFRVAAPSISAAATCLVCSASMVSAEVPSLAGSSPTDAYSMSPHDGASSAKFCDPAGVPKQGPGKIMLPDGGIYDGHFIDGMFQGFGKFTYSDGSVYEGHYEECQPHGEGTLKFANGASYTGSFLNGKRHGTGTYAYANGNVYEGAFRNGMRHGSGAMRYADGSVDVGDYADGVRVGAGRCRYADGTLLEGTYLDGVVHGVGTLTSKAGTVRVVQFDKGVRL